MIFREDGGRRAGSIAQPGWEQPPVCLALADGAKEPALAGGTGKAASPVRAELLSSGAGFRERTCKR